MTLINILLIPSQESVRFADYASQLMMCVGRCIAHFNDAEAFATAKSELLAHHCPHIDTSATYRDRSVSMRQHLEVCDSLLFSLPSSNSLCY